VALVTGAVSPYRREPFRLLADQEGAEVLAWGEGEAGSAQPVPGSGSAPALLGPAPPLAAPEAHEDVEAPGPPVRRVSERGAARLAASGRYRAVVCGLGGRVALPGCYLGARAASVPFVLWASLWAHPRSAAHLASYLPTRHLYRHADAVVTYGPHVSAYVAARRGGRGGIFEAPQAVSIAHFGQRVAPDRAAAARRAAAAPDDGFLALFVGRLVPEKGIELLIEAWRTAELGPDAALALAGEGPLRALAERGGRGVRALGPVSRAGLPALYAAADVLVLPSQPTATFLEPWGLVCNEAMLQSTPVIASTAVGAVAAGLVRHEGNGLVFTAGRRDELVDRLRTLYPDPALRRRLGATGRVDALAYSEQAWVDGVRAALASVGASRS
jgi:glycosyltransferase involved in cell wall biosynthesis